MAPISKLHTSLSRRTLIVVFCVAYVALASGYLLLVAHESNVWEKKRKELIEASPVVWVAPYGIHYHQESHYGRRLSSPLSLYEATERGYERCNICSPPLPAQISRPPVWVRRWLAILAASSVLWLASLAVFYKSGRWYLTIAGSVLG